MQQVRFPYASLLKFKVTVESKPTTFKFLIDSFNSSRRSKKVINLNNTISFPYPSAYTHQIHSRAHTQNGRVAFKIPPWLFPSRKFFRLYLPLDFLLWEFLKNRQIENALPH